LQVFPDVTSNNKIPYGSFLTCSADGTVRVWNTETGYGCFILFSLITWHACRFPLSKVSDMVHFPLVLSHFREQNGIIQEHLQQGILETKCKHDFTPLVLSTLWKYFFVERN
jgi:WD40 repeat protein